MNWIGECGMLYMYRRYAQSDMMDMFCKIDLYSFTEIIIVERVI